MPGVTATEPPTLTSDLCPLGNCTWGMNCRFIHPGVNDKGNYSLISKAEPFPPNGAPPLGPHPLMPTNPWVCLLPGTVWVEWECPGPVAYLAVLPAPSNSVFCRVGQCLMRSYHHLLQSLPPRVPGSEDSGTPRR